MVFRCRKPSCHRVAVVVFIQQISGSATSEWMSDEYDGSLKDYCLVAARSSFVAGCDNLKKLSALQRCFAMTRKPFSLPAADLLLVRKTVPFGQRTESSVRVAPICVGIRNSGQLKTATLVLNKKRRPSAQKMLKGYPADFSQHGYSNALILESLDERCAKCNGCNPKLTMTHVQLRLVMYNRHAVLYSRLVDVETAL